MEEDLIKRLIASIKCAACGQHYGEDDIDIIEHNEELWFLKVLCPSCRTRCLVAAIIRDGEKVEVVNDLTEAERERFAGLAGVGVDDVLDMHNFLKDFNGDVPRLLQQG
jgi:hypothetical protein